MEERSAEYQAEYDKASAALDEAEKSTTPRGADGKFVKAEAVAEVKTEPQAPPAVAAETQPAPDPLQEMRERLEKQEKALKDTQAWGTRNAQELAALKREREQAQREQQKPKILDERPDLADAIRYVQEAPKQESGQEQWQKAVSTAHPGIFDLSIDPELEKALLARREALGDEWMDPLVAIREITTEKLAHAERNIGKRFAAESALLAKKSAMAVPGAGSTSIGASVSPADDRDRILNMSDAEFAREVRKVKGY